MITKRDFALRGSCFCEQYSKYVVNHSAELTMRVTNAIDNKTVSISASRRGVVMGVELF